MTNSLLEQLFVVAKKASPRIRLVWDGRRQIAKFNGFVLVVTLVALYLVIDPWFESTAVILPDYGNKTTIAGQLGGLASVASLAGVDVGGGAPTEIYENLIESEAVLKTVIYSKYLTEEFPDSVSLLKFLERPGLLELLGVEFGRPRSPELVERKRFLDVYEELVEERISTDYDRLTKILTVTATMPEARLSADVANRVVQSLDEYIRIKRRSYAKDQLLYLTIRILEVTDSLGLAEEKLKTFKEQNRVTHQSPELLLEETRLMRSVTLQQTIYIELMKQAELAKLDEIRDTPIVNLREVVEQPVLKTGPRRILTTLLILFLSLGISVLFYLFRNDFGKLGPLVSVLDPRKS